jgi:hypothetical protein
MITAAQRWWEIAEIDIVRLPRSHGGKVTRAILERERGRLDDSGTCQWSPGYLYSAGDLSLLHAAVNVTVTVTVVTGSDEGELRLRLVG